MWRRCPFRPRAALLHFVRTGSAGYARTVLRDYRGVLVARRQEGSFYIRCVELFSDHLRVNWSAEGELATYDRTDPEDLHRFATLRRIAVTDDLGTEYEGGNGGGGGVPGDYEGHSSFRPAVPAQATELTLTTGFGSMVLNMADLAEPPN